MSSRGQPTGGGPPSWGLGECLQLLTVITYLVTKHSYSKPRTWTDTLVRRKQRERDMRFGARDVRSLHRAGSLTAAAKELARYKLDLVRLGGTKGVE